MTAWTPAHLSVGKLQLWIDINDAATLTDVGSGVISDILDKSGNGRHYTQSTSGKRGTRTASNSNYYNKPTLSVPLFGGYSKTGSWSWPFDIGQVADNIDGFGASISLNGGAFVVQLSTYPTKDMVAFHWTGGTPYGNLNPTNNAAAAWTNGAPSTIGYNGDGGQDGTPAAGGIVLVMGRHTTFTGSSYGRTFGEDQGLLNRTSDYGRSSLLELAELIICSGTMTTDDRQRLEGYSSWKWAGDGSLLPSGHPYKSAAPTTGGTDVIPAVTNLRTTAWTPPTPGPIAQKHVLTATTFRTQAWTKPTPTLVQKHVLTVTNVRTGAPIFPTTLTLGGQLTVTNLRTASPILGTPVINQKHVLTSAGLRTSVLIFGTPALGQKHVLTAAGKRTSSPILGPAYLNGATPPARSDYKQRWFGMKVGQGSG